ncbi:MAG: HYR domain-containing protein, partial [Acidobacteriota bacterium]|nr:HYR domain-containing protein [Acidobacteriota bacterium]
MKTGNAPKPHQHHYLNVAVRLGILIVLVALVTVPLYTVSSSSSPRSDTTGANSKGARQKEPNLSANQSRGISAHGELSAALKGLPLFSTLTLVPQASLPSVTTFAAGCVTPRSTFVLGEVVCAHVTGGTTFPRRLSWVDPSGFIRQVTPITSDPQDITFQIPATQTSMVGNSTVDNRGTWRVNMISSRSSIVTSTQFVVTDPAKAAADLSVSKSVSVANEQVAAGSSGSFQIYVRNNGPDAAQNVVLTDDVPANTTFVAMTQTDGPAFTCTTPSAGGTGTITCTIASLARGDSATFDFAYTVVAGTPAGTIITNTATVSSATEDPNTNDNSSTAYVTVASGGGGGGCSLSCPGNITTPADTTDNGTPGAIVHFDPPTGSGSCGSIATDHCNDCFFPVGTTVVNATSETGGGQCSFTVTVTEGAAPTIICPPDKTGTADSSCQATVDPGSPTTTGSNVTVTSSRSDGLPMSAPYPAGATTITWTASNSSGTVSCQQTVTVKDTTAPTITCPASITTGNDAGQCSATVDPGTATATDNCDSSPTVTGTRSDGQALNAPYPKGTTTITWTATDGSGNGSSCTQTVTVNDTEKPTITCPAPTSASADANCQAPVPDVASGATASDNCSAPGSITKTQSPAAGTMVGSGTHTITVTAKDEAGNSSTCTTTFTV